MESSQIEDLNRRNQSDWQPKRCENPWKPNTNCGQSEVYRRMLGILNRVTQQSLHILVEQVMELPITNPEHLPQILSLLMVKAQDEPLFVPTYARFCAELSRRIEIKDVLIDASHTHFMESHRYLRQFEDVLKSPVSIQEIKREILTRKRLTVHIGFICELQRRGIGTLDNLASLASYLRGHEDLRSLECLCRLLSFSGVALAVSHQDVIDYCFDYLQTQLARNTILPRLRFLLVDTIDLRANGWRHRQGNILSGRNVRG